MADSEESYYVIKQALVFMSETIREERARLTPHTRVSYPTPALLPGNRMSAGKCPEKSGGPDGWETEDSEEMRIFEIANMELEVDDRPATTAPSAPVPSLKEFVMCKDTQPQVAEAPDNLDDSDCEGLEEVLTDMMEEFKLDLCYVTQALLKNNGEVGSTRHFLRTGVRPDGYPIWEYKDDLALKKNRPEILKELCEKYSMRNVAQRALFLVT